VVELSCQFQIPGNAHMNVSHLPRIARPRLSFWEPGTNTLSAYLPEAQC
jgi:hypothetical protein